MLFQKPSESGAYGDLHLTDNEIAIMLLKAILEQKDPKVQSLLIEKLGSGPSGRLVADCIARLSQLGLTIQEPAKDPSPSPQDKGRAFQHPAHRTLQ